MYARVIQNRPRARTARAGRKSPVDASGLLGTSAEGIVEVDDSLHLTEAVTELGKLRLQEGLLGGDDLEVGGGLTRLEERLRDGDILLKALYLQAFRFDFRFRRLVESQCIADL